MTAQPSSQAEREDVAREVLYDHGDLMPRYEAQMIAAMLAFSDREHATPRSMPEEVVEAYERAAKVAEDGARIAKFQGIAAGDEPKAQSLARILTAVAKDIRAIPGASA